MNTWPTCWKRCSAARTSCTPVRQKWNGHSTGTGSGLCRGAAFAEKRRCSLPRWGAGVGASMRRPVSARSPHPRLPPVGEGADHDGTTWVLFLVSEANAPFLKVLALFEKLGVIESIDAWQMCRTARNLAAHDDETDCALIAEHFNELHTLQAVLVGAGSRLLALCAQTLSVLPTTADFEAEFRPARLRQPWHLTTPPASKASCHDPRKESRWPVRLQPRGQSMGGWSMTTYGPGLSPTSPRADAIPAAQFCCG